MTRAFIIGNGPSLKDTPLELLKDEVCFAVNKIFLLFDKTEWRPTHYVRAESWYNHKEIKDDIGRILEAGLKCYLNEGFKLRWRESYHRCHKKTQVNFFTNCPAHTQLVYTDPDVPTEWHLPEICGFGGSIPAALQWAVKLGFGPLYLLGCDLGYQDGGENHFIDGYESTQLRPADVYNGNIGMAHEIAANSSPVPIFNATLGGELEAYPRVNLMEILRKKEYAKL